VRSDQALQLLDKLLWTAFLVSAPVLLACLVVGVAVSVLQVATQLQEATLSYVPKLLVAGIVLVALGPWMIHEVTAFAIAMIKLVPSLG
jgi:flagellar biosynthetic protein FliQ